jgi:hypothetical protein
MKDVRSSREGRNWINAGFLPRQRVYSGIVENTSTRSDTLFLLHTVRNVQSLKIQ